MDGLKDDRFGRQLLHGSAPLLVWALHFFGAYAFVAVTCCSALADLQWLGLAAPRVLLLAGTALALGLIALLLVRGRRRPAGLLRSAATGSAVLALAGVAWTTLPMMVLPVCQCG